MVHDVALEAHEHAEHAEHAAQEHDPLIARITMTVATLAVLAAVAGSLESVEGGKALGAASEAVLMQDEATDSWAEFQSDSLKKNMYAIAAAAGGALADEYGKTSKENADKQKADRTKAARFEAERDKLRVESGMHENRHHWLTGAATLFEIGIALSTVAIITRRKWLWMGATLFGAGGIILLAAAYIA